LDDLDLPVSIDAKLGADEKVLKEALCAELMADAVPASAWSTQEYQVFCQYRNRSTST